MTIHMPRGDIRLVRFLAANSEGSAIDVDFTEIYFTVKHHMWEQPYQFQKAYN